ncbi:MAG: M15 family metallopeptidase [Acidimicrobiales bacterium]|nr:M15 family metallopeptidase [Acidimicrobiales bacterium]
MPCHPSSPPIHVHRPDRRERGQALPLVLVALALAVAVMMATGGLAQRAVAAAQARTAADAAALAGAARGEEEARAVAADNDAEVVAYAEAGPRVRVEVVVRGRHAVAAAERLTPPPSSSGAQGLTPEMQAAVARAEALLGQPVPITSGWRSPDQQQWLWDHRDTNPYPVARPGTSMHERGLAIDVPSWFVAPLRSVASEAGLCFPLPESDPIHFELCRPPGLP